MNNNGGIANRTTAIPVTQAYTIRNVGSNQPTQSCRGTEFISGMKIASDTPRGTIWKYPLNPVTDYYSGTRIGNLAASFQKYRFRRAALKIAANFSTTVGGNLVIGYSENPKVQLLEGEALFNQLFAMNGMSASLFTPVTMPARIADKAKWYNIDEDANANEIMNTTQGVFYIALQSSATITGDATIPIILEYDVEFKDQALQSERAVFSNVIDNFAAVTFIQRKEEQRGQYHVESGSPLGPNVIYKILDGVTLATRDGPVVANWFVHYENTMYSHGFYLTAQDAIDAVNPVVVNVTIDGTFQVGPLRLQQLLN